MYGADGQGCAICSRSKLPTKGISPLNRILMARYLSVRTKNVPDLLVSN